MYALSCGRKIQKLERLWKRSSLGGMSPVRVDVVSCLANGERERRFRASAEYNVASMNIFSTTRKSPNSSVTRSSFGCFVGMHSFHKKHKKEVRQTLNKISHNFMTTHSITHRRTPFNRARETHACLFSFAMAALTVGSPPNLARNDDLFLPTPARPPPRHSRSRTYKYGDRTIGSQGCAPLVLHTQEGASDTNGKASEAGQTVVAAPVARSTKKKAKMIHGTPR